MSSWKDVRKNDTLVLLGFALNTRDMAPWSDTVDIFTMNEWYNHGKWQEDKVTAHFQLHPYDNFMRLDNSNDPKHPDWMREKHPFPIFTQEVYEDVPSSTKYPLKEAIKIAGARYLTSSFSYMLAMGMLLKYPRIEMYGFNMGSGTEYQYQKPGAEYLIGVAKGMGIDVFIPEQSAILKDRLYGYDSLNTGFIQHLEFRKNSCADMKINKMLEWNRAKGAKDVTSLLLNNEFGKLIAPLLQQYIPIIGTKGNQALAEVNICVGAESELDQMLTFYKKLLGESNNG